VLTFCGIVVRTRIWGGFCLSVSYRLDQESV
jgi:hypothetical protein